MTTHTEGAASYVCPGDRSPHTREEELVELALAGVGPWEWTGNGYHPIVSDGFAFSHANGWTAQCVGTELAADYRDEVSFRSSSTDHDAATAYRRADAARDLIRTVIAWALRPDAEPMPPAVKAIADERDNLATRLRALADALDIPDDGDPVDDVLHDVEGAVDRLRGEVKLDEADHDLIDHMATALGCHRGDRGEELRAAFDKLLAERDSARLNVQFLAAGPSPADIVAAMRHARAELSEATSHIVYIADRLDVHHGHHDRRPLPLAEVVAKIDDTISRLMDRVSEARDACSDVRYLAELFRSQGSKVWMPADFADAFEGVVDTVDGLGDDSEFTDIVDKRRAADQAEIERLRAELSEARDRLTAVTLERDLLAEERANAD